MNVISSSVSIKKKFAGLFERKAEIFSILNNFCNVNKISLPQMRSQFLRPLITYEIAKHLRLKETSSQLHCGALAVQTIHEASLFHDDIIDNANTRHHKTTPLNQFGVSNALMQGDMLIAKSFELITKTKCLEAITYYSSSNLKVIEGELLQNKKVGEIISNETYNKIISLKTGALFGSAASVAVYIFLQNEKKNLPQKAALITKKAKEKITNLISLATEIGLLYQMLDDFLDFLPEANTGKTPFQDYSQQKYTFVLNFLPNFSWENAPKNILPVLLKKTFLQNGNASESTPLEQSFNYFLNKKKILLQKLLNAGLENSALPSLLNYWQESAYVSFKKTVSTASKTKTN